MIRDDHINEVQKRLNSFDDNLKFTVDKFEDGIIHFFDILILSPQIQDSTPILIVLYHGDTKHLGRMHCMYAL